MSDEDNGGGRAAPRPILVPDFLQANDWKIGRFLVLVVTLQAIVLLLIFLDDLGLVPLTIRQLAAFLFYSYIPGLVLLRVLRVHRLGSVLTTLVSVGASVVLMMFVGLALDLVYLKLSGPLPFVLPVVLLGQTLAVVLLCALAYVIDRRHADEPVLDVAPLLSTSAFVLYSLPLTAVLSTYLLNGWNEPLLQIVLLIVIAAVVLTLLLVRLPSSLYPVAVVCIGLAMVLHTSLVSRFVVEWADLSFEYWSANSTLINGYWDLMGVTRTDTVISVTILAPMYSLLGGMDLNQVFKLCYPALLSLVPLGAFQVTRQHIGERSALLAAFIIISGTVFYTEMLGLARQTVAELMLVAIMALVTCRSTGRVNKMLLAWALALGLIVSHYGVLAIAGPTFLVAGALYLVLERKSRLRLTVAQFASSAAFLALPSILWYGLLSNALVLEGLRKHFYALINGMGGSVGWLDGLLGTVLLHQDPTDIGWLKASLVVLTVTLSFIGLYAVARRRRAKVVWDNRYLALAIPFAVLSLLTLFDTNLFVFISRERFFHMCLLFLAPLAAYGGVCLFRSLNHWRNDRKWHRTSIATFGSVLVVGFLLNAGVVAVIVGEPVPIEFDMGILDVPRHSDGAFLGASFTIENRGDSRYVFADANRAYLLDLLGGQYHPFYGRSSVPVHSGSNDHYFLSSENLDGWAWLEDPNGMRLNKTYRLMDANFSQALLRMDKVYASQEAELYYKKF